MHAANSLLAYDFPPPTPPSCCSFFFLRLFSAYNEVLGNSQAAHVTPQGRIESPLSRTSDSRDLPLEMEKHEERQVEDWGSTDSGLPSVTLKLALDRNGAVDDLSDGPKRFTCPTSLDQGAVPWFSMEACTSYPAVHTLRYRVSESQTLGFLPCR